MRARSEKYQRPEFLQTSPFYLVTIPFVQTSGAPGSCYEWNNGAHAALHSILAGLQCEQKEHVSHWLGEAKRQIDEAVRCINRPTAKAMPRGAGTEEERKLIAARFVNWRGALWPYAPTTHQLTMGGGQ